MSLPKCDPPIPYNLYPFSLEINTFCGTVVNMSYQNDSESQNREGGGNRQQAPNTIDMQLSINMNIA